jgi:hypothetical protein
MLAITTLLKPDEAELYATMVLLDSHQAIFLPIATTSNKKI